MWQMVTIEVEISASVGGPSVGFSGQCCLFPEDKITTSKN
jgi:hypothetical protein